MIKIIKNSMIDPIRIQCKHCKSEFEYNYEDIERREIPGLFSISTSYYKRYIVCPVCKREIDLNDKVVIKSEAINGDNNY